MHTHGGDTPGSTHSHGGSGSGLGFDLLDAIVCAAAIAVAILLGEMLIKARRDRVRYDLTPEGRAAAEARTAPLVDLDKLREAVDRGDLGTDHTAGC